MSRRTMFSSLSNSAAANVLASSVLPTPVGPRKTKDPIGRRGSRIPERARITASATSWTASSWPITRSCRISSSRSSFSRSPSCSRATGIPVQAATIFALCVLRAGDRDTSPGGDYFGDLLLGDDLAEQRLFALLGLQLFLGGLQF